MSSIIEIQSFEQVIMLALQRKGATEDSAVLSFGEVWTWCSNAGFRLPCKIDAQQQRSKFVAQMFESLDLLQSAGIVWAYRDGKGKIMNVGLTAKGKEYLAGVVFSHQDRCPSPEAPASRGRYA